MEIKNKKMKTIDFFKKRKAVPSNWDFPEFTKLKPFKLHKRNVNAWTKKEVAASQEWKCRLCKKSLPPSYDTDHIIDLFLGGSNEKENLEALCNDCHAMKTQKTLNLFNIYKKRYNLTRTT